MNLVLNNACSKVLDWIGLQIKDTINAVNATQVAEAKLRIQEGC